MPAASPEKREEFRQTLLNLHEEMNKVIFGQEAAIDALDRALKISFSGLRTKNKTAGAFLFMGPTGSGKTETAEQLAQKLGVPIKRIDCGEFQHSHEIAKLVGAPPGYLGHRETESVLGAFHKKAKDAPYAVLVLDEIEKADPALYQLCLGLLDKGTVTDGNNVEMTFENLIVIMTSNVGEKDRKRASVGFLPSRWTSKSADPSSPAENRETLPQESAASPTVSTGKSGARRPGGGSTTLRLVFSPEFLGRLDGVISFADFTPDLIPLITDKFITELQDTAKNNPNASVEVGFTPAARKFIAAGFKPEEGARSIRKYLSENVAGRLANEIIDGPLQSGGDVLVDLAKDGNTLTFAFNQRASDDGSIRDQAPASGRDDPASSARAQTNTLAP